MVTPRRAVARPSEAALARFVGFVREREAIRLKKEAGDPRPWTTDPILHHYKFTCVRRMDDRVSRWLLDNWYRPYKDHPNTLAAVLLARHFNKPDTLQRMTNWVYTQKGPPNWHKLKAEPKARKANGYKVFSAAYMISGRGGTCKIDSVVDLAIRPLVEKAGKEPLVDTASMQRTHEALAGHWGIASFMAGQVVADLRHALSGWWKDKHAWAPVGPGSARGLARMLCGDEWRSAATTYRRDQDGWLMDLKDVLSFVKPRLPADLASRLEMMDFQNCLCEADKYERTRLGEGRPKHLYRSTT